MESSDMINLSLLLLRIITAVIFFSSGKSHVQKPKERSESIGLSSTATLILGIAEIIGAIFIGFGLFTKLGAVVLILAMVGALYKKIFIWKTKFFEEKGYGWHYDLLLLFGLLVILATSGGKFIIFNIL